MYNQGRYRRGSSTRRRDDTGSGSDAGPSARRGARHPPNLRGKEIGLFYARKNKARQRWQTKNQRVAVTVPLESQHRLTRILGRVRSEGRTQRRDLFSPDYLDHVSASGITGAVPPMETSPCGDSALDSRLHEDFCRKQKRPDVAKMLQFRKRLPAYKMREEIVDLVEKNGVVVVSGETGSGKTTQIPQFILDHYILAGKGSRCKVVCTQPRRISAISVAERVAAERGERCGEAVGYHIRLECKMPRPAGSILFCTTGILLQQMQSDPYILGASHVILDEVHERDLQTDFLVVILKDLLRLRSDVRVVLMSATINAELFSTYFGGCPTLQIPGVAFPVQVFYLEDAIEETGYRGPEHWRPRRKAAPGARPPDAFFRHLEQKFSARTVDLLKEWDEERIDLRLTAAVVKHVCNTKPEGAILVFLPGWESISEMNRILGSMSAELRDVPLVVPLHSMMPTMDQRKVFDRPPPGVRKIVVATNIAETSITVDDVVYVVDCGKIKISNFDVDNNLATLQPEWVSLANAQQRRGRAGRVRPGVCYRLYTSWRETQLEAYQAPEMLRTRLETLILKIKILKLGDARTFLENAMDPPSSDAVRLSIEFLESLKALDENEALTPLGYHLARLPLDPQTGKMIILASIFSCLDPVLTVAASLSFKDAFTVPLGKEKVVDRIKVRFAGDSKSDHVMLANVFHEWEEARRRHEEDSFCYGNFLSKTTLRMLDSMRKQFLSYLKELNFVDTADAKAAHLNANSENMRVVTAVVCAGLYPNVARGTFAKRLRLRSLSTKTDRRVALHPKSVNCTQSDFDTPWFVYYTKIRSTKVFLHDVTPVYPLALLLFGGTLKLKEGEVVLDGWISMPCEPALALLIKEVRHELDRILEQKINVPGTRKGDASAGQLLDAVVELLSRETTALPDLPQEEGSGESDHERSPDALVQ